MKYSLPVGGLARITVLATEGSAPRGAGATMLVAPDRTEGTIGGGALEYRAIDQARRLLAEGGGWRVQDYPLGPLLGQCCGGRVRLLIERDHVGEGAVLRFAGERVLREAGEAPPCSARGARPETGDRIAAPPAEPGRPVLLFGAGHVGRAVARALSPLPFALGWFDPRAETEQFGATIAAEDEAEACARAAPAEAALLILTHDHALDYRLTAAALAGAAAYVGLIGSATKRARFVSRLGADGIDSARLTCPIGLPGITGKEPAVIAAAVAAQLLALR